MNDAAPRVDQVIEGLVFVLVLFLALSFGGVMPFSHGALIGTAALIAALFAVRCFLERAAPLVWSWALVPAGLYLVGVALQVVPLPLGVLETLSPRTAALWREVGIEDRATLSLYPHATWVDLRLWLAILTVAFAAVSVYRDRDAFRRLLAGFGLIGCAVATIGVVQLLLGADKIYWLYESPVSVITAGPFASYSHYSEFLNLCLGCALGYLLVRALDRSHGRPIELRDLVDLRMGQASRLDRVLAVFLILGVLAIALSTSRNGLISIAFGGAVVGLAMQITRKVDGVGWPMIGVTAVAFLALLFLGFDPIYTRMSETLDDPIEAYGVRAALVRDTWQMATALPLLGAGLGAYGVAFPMFDTSVRGGTANNAENQYMEVLAETGFFGAACVLAAVALVVAALVRMTRTKRSRTDIAGFGLAYGVAAVGFHALTDFGLELPAVGLLACLVAAAALARGARLTTLATKPRFAAGAVALTCAVCLAASLPPTVKLHEAERASALRVQLHKEMKAPAFRGTPEQHDLLEAAVEAAHGAAPDDVIIGFWRALHTWTNAVARALDYGEPKGTVSPETNPELVEVARRVHGELAALRRLAPTFGPLWSAAGQLGLVWLDEPEAGAWIVRGRELAPHHPAACLASGVLKIHDGDEAGGLADLERASQVGASQGSIVTLLASDVHRPDLAYRIAAGKRPLLEVLRGHLRRAPAGHEELLARVETEADALLELDAGRAGASGGLLAQLANLRARQGQTAEAIGLFHRALAKEPDHRCRYDLAKLLADQGEPREALRQLRDLLGLHPDHSAARKLLEKLEQEQLKR